MIQYPQRGRDAKNLPILMHEYLETGNAERLYEEG